MSKIKIKNFGPISNGLVGNDGFIDIKQITVFIGDQATGKSTIAKTYSTFSWLEKALTRRLIKINKIKDNDNFLNEYFNYQGLREYFREGTHLEYIGKSYSFIYKDETLEILNNNSNYLVPKIMYVPAERNFISAVDKPEKVEGLPKPLYTFLSEFDKAKKSIISSDIPINEIKFSFDKQKNESYISEENYKIPLLNASSGIQSATPLYLVSKFLSSEEYQLNNVSKMQLSLEENEKSIKKVEALIEKYKLYKELEEVLVKSIYSKYQTNCFINIVEEIEQNLYPTSQKSLLYSLLGFVNKNKNNKLILTTHSPFIINYLTLSIKAKEILKKVKSSKYKENKLHKIVPIDACIDGNKIIIYELDNKGNIKKLDTYNNLPSDTNYLNNLLEEANDEFDELNYLS